MNAGLVQAVVEAPVAVVLENGIVDGFDNPGALGSIGQLGIMLLELVPQEKAPIGLDDAAGRRAPVFCFERQNRFGLRQRIPFSGWYSGWSDSRHSET